MVEIFYEFWSKLCCWWNFLKSCGVLVLFEMSVCRGNGFVLLIIEYSFVCDFVCK